MKKLFYSQCTLSFGNYTEVAWIPTNFAELNKNLEIDVGIDERDEVMGQRIRDRRKCYVTAIGATMELSPDEIAKMTQQGKSWKNITDY